MNKIHYCPIAQIASDTGFKSAAYFSKFFHEHVGSSPVQFRRHSANQK